MLSVRLLILQRGSCWVAYCPISTLRQYPTTTTTIPCPKVLGKLHCLSHWAAMAFWRRLLIDCTFLGHSFAPKSTQAFLSNYTRLCNQHGFHLKPVYTIVLLVNVSVENSILSLQESFGFMYDHSSMWYSDCSLLVMQLECCSQSHPYRQLIDNI